ncbi:MAG TPA: efflux RND transporter periplasmic adaptor subunit [Terriglobia bacterium]|nr:efflux RND transporter periplasmic adaptor subunit [Terriglobia bacterium]
MTSATLALVILFTLAYAGCARKSSEASASTAVAYGEAASGDSQARLFTVPQDQMAHVQIVTLEPSRLSRVLRLTGSVAYNSFETTPVITPVSGPVVQIMAAPGDTVRKGQPLLDVSSPDFATLRQTYLKTKDALALAEKNNTRAKDLYAHHAIAEADLQAADSARNQAAADFQAAAQSLRVLGISQPDGMAADAATPEIPVRAPIGGEVVERLVGPGQVIQGGQTQCFTISNLRTVWVLANVYQHDLGSIHLGDAVEIQTDAYREVFHGRISYIAPALDPNTRTLQVRIVTDNPGGKLKNNMYVTATVQAGAIQNAIAVPDAAILRTAENHPFVYVESGANQFGQRLVDIGESQNGKTEITSGLAAGDHVAADGSLFLQFANSLQR